MANRWGGISSFSGGNSSITLSDKVAGVLVRFRFRVSVLESVPEGFTGPASRSSVCFQMSSVMVFDGKSKIPVASTTAFTWAP